MSNGARGNLDIIPSPGELEHRYLVLGQHGKDELGEVTIHVIIGAHDVDTRPFAPIGKVSSIIFRQRDRHRPVTDHMDIAEVRCDVVRVNSLSQQIGSTGHTLRKLLLR